MNESSITNFCIKILNDENVKREVKNIYILQLIQLFNI